MPGPKYTAGHIAVDRSAPWTIQLPNGQQHGPLSGPEIQSLLESWVIPPSSLAWNAQVGSWQRVVDVISSVAANHGGGATSRTLDDPPTALSTIEPELTQLLDHIQVDRQRSDRDRQKQAASSEAAAQEIKAVSEWSGRAVAAGTGLVLVMVAVGSWVGLGPQNFNLGRAAVLPMLLAGATAALASWILPYYYSSVRRQK